VPEAVLGWPHVVGGDRDRVTVTISVPVAMAVTVTVPIAVLLLPKGCGDRPAGALQLPSWAVHCVPGLLEVLVQEAVWSDVPGPQLRQLLAPAAA
jgi:hypothetical protein